MITLRIRQSIALLLLIFYFLYKTVALIDYSYLNSSTEPQTESPQSYLYLLDSGHGPAVGCDNKAVKVKLKSGRDTCFYEWMFNWKVREVLAHKLDSANIQYQFVNDDYGEDMHMDDRVAKVNRICENRKCVLLSIHGNAAQNKKAKGLEVYSTKDYDFSDSFFQSQKKAFSDSLAKKMFANYKSEFCRKGDCEHVLRRNTQAQGYKEKGWTIITKTRCPAILTENGFFTNEREMAIMSTRKFKERIAEAHFQLIKWAEKH